jgi:predicted nucleotide-binding protein
LRINRFIPDEKAIQEEENRLRRLRAIILFASTVIRQGNLPLEEVEKFLESIRNAALVLFPDKGEVYDLIYRPRFKRIISEVYRLS